jgi:hypothetical protein
MTVLAERVQGVRVGDVPPLRGGLERRTDSRAASRAGPSSPAMCASTPTGESSLTRLRGGRSDRSGVGRRDPV